jgi:uncharacterized protein with HEPN domain
MPHNPAKLYEDILRAITELTSFCAGKNIADFKKDRQLQLAVERSLEIVGEAIFRLRLDHPKLAEQISDAHKIIGMRNILAHGYDAIDHDILWDAALNKLPVLHGEILKLSGQ